MSEEDYYTENDNLWGETIEKIWKLPRGRKLNIAVPKAVADDKPTRRFIRTVIEISHGIAVYHYGAISLANRRI